MHVPRSLATGGPQRPMFVARRRRRGLPLVILALLALAAIWFGLYGQPMAASGTAGSSATSAPVIPPEEPSAAPADPSAQAETAAFATFEDLPLHLPTTRPVLVGFHEASSRDALEMRPIGAVVENENTTKFDPPAEVDEGSDYLVLSSRGRPQAATSAVDVMMRKDDPVRSPVHGSVTDVREYHLYGSHQDYRLEIAPDDRPELRIVLIHVDEVEVEVGDVVVAGQTILAGTARPFPFGSQIDRYTEPDRWPHVHLEVKHEDADEDDD
jgi:biotin carboxyl carrier protein